MEVYSRGFLRLEDRLDEEDRSDRLMLLPHVCQDGVCVCVRMCVWLPGSLASLGRHGVVCQVHDQSIKQ